MLFELFLPIAAIIVAACLTVLRVGTSAVFFNVLAHWNAEKLITDSKTSAMIIESVMVDSYTNILGTIGEVGQQIEAMTNATIDLGVSMEEARIDFEKFVNVDSVIVLKI